VSSFSDVSHTLRESLTRNLVVNYWLQFNTLIISKSLAMNFVSRFNSNNNSNRSYSGLRCRTRRITERGQVLVPHTEPYLSANSSGNTGYLCLVNVWLDTWRRSTVERHIRRYPRHCHPISETCSHHPTVQLFLLLESFDDLDAETLLLLTLFVAFLILWLFIHNYNTQGVEDVHEVQRTSCSLTRWWWRRHTNLNMI